MKLKSWVFAGFWIGVLPCRSDVNTQLIALNCLSCHQNSTDASVGGIPLLTGLSGQTLHRSLLDFKYDRKQATLMSRIAKGYSDDELQAVAEFLAMP